MSQFWARTMSFRRYDGNPDSPALTSRRNAADPLSSRRAEITLDLKQEMAATDPREAVAIKGRDSRSRITSETELTTIHSSSVRVFNSRRTDENAAQRIWFDCTPHPYGDPALGRSGASSSRSASQLRRVSGRDQG